MKDIYINGKIIDGTKEMAVKEGYAIVVENKRIREIVKLEEVNLNQGHVIDLKGHYIMPGLINMHVHLAGNGKPQKENRDNEKLVKRLMSHAFTRAMAYKMVSQYAKDELMSGVTTIRTVGGIHNFDSRLRDEINCGKKTGPRILAANEGISVPGGHMAGSVAIKAHSIDEALLHVDLLKEQGVDLVKLMITGGVLDATKKGSPGELKMSPEMVKAVCDKAHRLGFKVAAHVESSEGVRVALENGVDSIEHGGTLDDHMIQLLKENNSFICTTLSPVIPYAFFDESISHASEMARYNAKVVFDGVLNCAKQAIENNIPVVLGNDVGCPWITQYDFWRELYYFHKYVGVSQKEALYCATLQAANMAGIGHLTGSIEVGKDADMIVTQGNPLEDLRALRHVEMVITRGERIEHPKVKINPSVQKELDKFL